MNNAEYVPYMKLIKKQSIEVKWLYVKLYILHYYVSNSEKVIIYLNVNRKNYCFLHVVEYPSYFDIINYFLFFQE